MISLATYRASVPYRTKVSADKYLGLDFVYGEFGAKREVFTWYYPAERNDPFRLLDGEYMQGEDDLRVLAETIARDGPPHIQFARCGDDLDSIKSFTKEWGVLGKKEDQPDVFQHFLGLDYGEETLPGHYSRSYKESYFAFSAIWWREQQSRFREAMELAASRRPDSEVASRINQLLPYPSLSQIDRGGFVIRAASLAEEGVRRTQFLLEATTLMDAFWLMLLFDLSPGKNTLGICEKCGLVFTGSRARQRYCSEVCRRRAAQLNYWHRNKHKIRPPKKAHKK